MSNSINLIHQVNAATKDAYTYYPIVIVGAGESGICMGARLQQALNFDQFRIFERKSALGGTWYTNTYPGIACDVPAICYSFSFFQNSKWTGPFPKGKEIIKYLYDACAQFKILDKIQCDTNVKSMVWNEKDEEWELILEYLAPGVGDMSSAERKTIENEKGVEATVLREEHIRAKIVCSAVGGLVEPKQPLDLPGKENFQGKIVHTARWDNSIDLKEKNVVVVGTGCSAGQVVPQLVKPEYSAKKVIQLMRSPPWTVGFLGKKGNETWKNWMPFLCTYIPGFQDTLRKFIFGMMEVEFVSLFHATEAARARRIAQGKEVLKYMHAKVPKKYHEILTPDYELFCKRRVIDDGWFDSLNNDKIELTTMPLTSFGPGPNEVTLGPGRQYPPPSDSEQPEDKRTVPCDVLVLANGYDTNVWLHPLTVTGRGGVSLSELWAERGGAQAYLGTAMDKFPNFFMIFGPNTATGHSSVILASENMTNHALTFIAPILNSEISTVEITETAERAYTSELQRLLRKSLFTTGGCVNWYTDRKTGWNSTVYPRTQIDFMVRCMVPIWWHWNVKYTRKGVLKLWINRIMKVLGFVAVIVAGGYTARFGRMRSREKVFGLIDGLLSWVGRRVRAVGVGA